MNKRGKAAKTGKKAIKPQPKGGATANGARKVAKKLERSFKLPIKWGKRK
ncbi:MAG TPA: hypothetical protein VIV12_22885 [Streptosporangiaceae bacterium]